MKFIIKDFCYINSEDEIQVSQVHPLIRRKMSLLDKVSFTTMSKLFNESIEEIVFSSQYGEFTRLETLISQYVENNEVSPACFSASVHNYPVSFFTLFKKLNITYYALSAGSESFQAGFIKSVISRKETLYTYADVFNGIKSVSMIISPIKVEP